MYKYAHRMKNRHARHRTIRHLIASRQIESQEDLREQLSAEGFDVTQATLSRDLRYLQVGKIADGSGGYYYGIQEGGEDYVHDLTRGWISIGFSGQLGVIRTLPGHANSVAVAIDNLEFGGLLGTVAGDDTILLVLKEGVSSDTLIEQLKAEVPSLGDSVEQRNEP